LQQVILLYFKSRETDEEEMIGAKELQRTLGLPSLVTSDGGDKVIFHAPKR